MCFRFLVRISAFRELYKRVLTPLIIVLLVGCSASKGPKINAEHHTSEQDIVDILSIVTDRLETVLGRKLNNKPKINFITKEELRAKMLTYSKKSDEALKSLTHYTQTVAAIYSPSDKEIYVIPENIEIYERINSLSSNSAYYALLHILSHELVHALQDQEGLLSWQGASKEERRAFSILVEGHTELQTAIILHDMKVISNIYDYGIDHVLSDTNDEEFNKYSDEFSLKYVIGKKVFNKIHKLYGNERAWQVLEKPEEQIKQILNKR